MQCGWGDAHLELCTAFYFRIAHFIAGVRGEADLEEGKAVDDFVHREKGLVGKGAWLIDCDYIICRWDRDGRTVTLTVTFDVNKLNLSRREKVEVLL